MFFKPMIVLVFLLVTREAALWVLPLAMFFDGMANAGLMVASNGYMMKIAPKQNRSMFMAAIVGLSGICGGVGSVVAGSYLTFHAGAAFHVFGRTWSNYHVLFLLAFFLRIGCAGIIHWVREPKSSRTAHVLNDICGVWPLRFLRFPIGLYRRDWDDEE